MNDTNPLQWEQLLFQSDQQNKLDQTQTYRRKKNIYEKKAVRAKNAFISKSCFSYQFYQLNYYYYYSLSYPFFSVFKLLNDLDPVALSEENNVSQFYRYFSLVV